jgi:uncharacterized protein
MRHLVLVAFFSIWANILVCAQEPCKYASEDAFDALAKALSQAKSCGAAAAKMRDCAWGSSADTQLAPIVIAKCEKTFFRSLSPAAQKRYEDEMQLCAYEYARQEGTMYMSAAALCQVDVATHFATDPAAARQPVARASFNCGKAQTPLEIAICSDIRIGHADIVLARVYDGKLKSSDKEDRSALIQSEKQWLQSIPAKCNLSVIPLALGSLDCVRNEFELRFTALDSCEDKIADCLQSSVDAGDHATVAVSVPKPRASFDCEAPSTALEIVICADADLGQTDINLAQAYQDADTVMIAAQHKDLIDSERQWLRFVRGTCPLGAVGGIPPVLTRSCIRTAFQTRIVQLQTCPQKEPQARIPCLNDFHLSEKKQGTQ